MITKDKAFYKSFASLTVALMLEQAVILSVNLADNVMLGSYSESALSGVAAVNQIQFVLQQLVYGISNGMIVLGSQYWGQGRTGEIRKLSSIAARSALGLTLTLFLLVSFFPRGALLLFTSNETIIAEGIAYLRIMRFSYMVFGLTTVMLGTLRIAESVRIALRVSVISLIVNISINYLLIPGRFGFPELGVRGAAIGTLAARIIEFTIVAVFIFKSDNGLDIHPADYLHVDRRMLKDYLRVSSPIIFATMVWGLNNALQTVILGHMDKSAIAAQSISSTLFLLLKVASVGAASAASVLIGKAVGAGDMRKVREYTRTLQILFIGIGAMLSLLFTAIRFPLEHLQHIRRNPPHGQRIHDHTDCDNLYDVLSDVRERGNHPRRRRYRIHTEAGYDFHCWNRHPPVAARCICLASVAHCRNVYTELRSDIQVHTGICKSKQL